MKVLGPTTDIPTWGSTKGTENPQGIWLWMAVEFDYRTSTGLGKADWSIILLEGTNKTLCAPGPRRMEQWPHRRLSQTHLWVSRSLPWRPELTAACRVTRGTEYNSPFEGSHYSSCGREHSPTHQQKSGLKIYWVWPCPSEQDPDFPQSQSLPSGSFHKPLPSIRGQAEWKPQLQKTNQIDHLEPGN